jgi:hypothetical protein
MALCADLALLLRGAFRGVCNFNAAMMSPRTRRLYSMILLESVESIHS